MSDTIWRKKYPQGDYRSKDPVLTGIKARQTNPVATQKRLERWYRSGKTTGSPPQWMVKNAGIVS